MSEPQKMAFSTIMKFEDFIVRDHRVHSTRIMPGVTFLDMIYRLLLSKGFAPDEVELRNILFKEPIATTEVYDKKIRITFEKQRDHWLVVAKSQQVQNGEPISDKWDDNLQCEMYVGARSPMKKISIAELTASALRTEDMDRTYSYMRKTYIDHYEFMKMLGRVHIGTGYRLAEAYLSGLAEQYLDHFYLHPAFMDGSTCVADAIMLDQFAEQGESKPFIPMFIESFRCTDRLGKKVYVFLPDGCTKVSASGDILYSDIELYDENGVLVASFTRLGFKRVRSQELILNLQRSSGVSVKAATAAATTATTAAPIPAVATAPVSASPQIEHDLQEMVAQLLSLPREQVDAEVGFYDQGLDSRQLLELVQQLEDKLETKLYPTLLFEYTSIRKLAEFLADEYGERYQPTVETLQATPAPKSPVTPVSPVTAGSLQGRIEQDLRQMIAELLETSAEEISIEAGFYDQGLDSRQLLELVQRLEEQIGQKMYPTLLFEYTSISKLARFLEEEYGAQYPVDSADSMEKGATSAHSDASVNKTEEPFFYQPVWVQSALVHANESKTPDRQTVLIVSSEGMNALEQALANEHAGDEVIRLRLGTRTTQQTDALVWELDARNTGAIEHALQGVERVDTVYFVNGNFGETPLLHDLEACESSQEQGVLSLFRLVKALNQGSRMSKLRTLKVIAERVHQIRPEERTVPWGGSLFGLAKTIAVEYPRTSISCLDVSFDTGTADLARAILAEPRQEYAQEVAIRGGRRYVQEIRAVQLPPTEPVLLRQSGVYLIVGGAGGIGLAMARHLARKVQARLILTGRRELQQEQRRQLAEIEQLGGEVLYVQADVTSFSDMRRVVREAKTKFGALHGVVHSAIALNDKVLPIMEEATFRSGLAPKVTGTAVLYKALQEESLDFLMFHSSVLSFVGNIGQSNYTAGCAFKDAFAHAIGQEKQYPVKIFNWGYWGSVGVGLTQDIQKQLAQVGAIPLDVSDGLDAIDRMLGLPLAQLIPLKADARMQKALGIDPLLPVEPYTQTKTYHVAPTTTAEPVFAPATGMVSSPAPIRAVQAPIGEEIAIVGVSGRYPQARDLHEFWENLKNGRDCVSEIPADRWDIEEYFHPDKNELGKMYSKWGGFLDDIDKFDPLFFNISPREAELMDPQERLFLETVWQAVEDAGYNKTSMGRKVGVYVGAMWGQYQMLVAERGGRQVVPSSIYASIANRVSYFYNFSGPSMALDTMCSSALTAIHLACESLRRGECGVAIAGGVNVSIHPSKYLFLSQNKFVSSDGRCRTFGEGGDGYVPGEGVGTIVLKPLQRAVEDGDRIYAVIKGSSINHGGYASGFYVPNPNAQAEVILETLEKCNIDPRTISYIEAHGTGTSLGDPIEITGLKKAFAKYTKDKQFCSIGSAKSNIGHLESAAGIAGITKILLQMQHGLLAPSLHAETLNSQIPFADTPFYVQRELTEWKRPVLVENGRAVTYPRRAAISSFGAGGSNAHIILEEYRQASAIEFGHRGPYLIVLSAKNAERLQVSAHNLADYLRREARNEAITLEAVAWTLQRKEAFEERLAFVGYDLQQVVEILERFSQNVKPAEVYTGSVKGGKATAAQKTAGERLEELARHFVTGGTVEWNRLYPQGVPTILSLPTYPFLRKRYWVDSYKGTESTPLVQSPSIEAKPVKMAQVVPQVSQTKQATAPAKRVLDEYRPVREYSGDEVSLEILDGNIALVTMSDRKNRNMFSDRLVEGLLAQFDKIRKNEQIKAVVLTGYDHVFSFGGTQEQLTKIANRTYSFTDVPFMYRGLLECEVPVIAAIQGHASGGGLLFGLYADLVVMAEECVYSAVFTKYGFTPGMGATLILKEKLGSNLANEMMYTARSYRGEELKERGASVQFRKSQDVVQEAISMARMLADKPRHTLKTLKQELAGRLLSSLPDVIECEERMHAETFSHPEVKQRIERFYLSSSTHASTNQAAAMREKVAGQANVSNQAMGRKRAEEATPAKESSNENRPSIRLRSTGPTQQTEAPEQQISQKVSLKQKGTSVQESASVGSDEEFLLQILSDLEEGLIDPQQAAKLYKL